MSQSHFNSAFQAVEFCWRETFEGLPFEADVPWCESGADSLKGTLFVLRLEERLGMTVELDSLGPETTPAELARTLAARRGGNTSDAGSAGEQPVFLLPGLLGDEPRLVAFRQAFQAPGLFEVLRLPDIERSARELASIGMSAAILAEEVERRQPSGAVRLFGYSVGGILAYEVASLLLGRGREVGLLGLLDPFLQLRATKRFRRGGNDPMVPGAGAIPRAGAWAVGMSREKLAFGLPLLVGDLERARRHLIAVRDSIPLETLYWRRQRLIGRLRWRALRNWRPHPLDVPAILVSSDEAEEHFEVAEWQRLLPRATRLHVGGTHLGLFEPEPLAQMLPPLCKALGMKA